MWVDHSATEQYLNSWFWYICPCYAKDLLGLIFSGLPVIEMGINKGLCNPPFQGKRRGSGSFLLQEILHLLVHNPVIRTKFSVEANFHFHICLHFEIMAI